MNKKTIKVDLSSFFDDERKMSCIFIDPNWKTVECLQKRVEILFELSAVCLLSDGCYLPSKEPIDIINYCEVIKAFVLKESQEVRKKKKSKKSKETLEKVESAEALEANNYLTNGNDEVVTSTPISEQTTNKLLEECKKEQKLMKILGNPSKKRKSDTSNFQDESRKVQEMFNSKNSTNPFKKRKSANDEMMSPTRLPKIASSTLLNESHLLEESKNAEQLSNSKIQNNPFKKCKPGKAHIYFDETGDILSAKSKKEKSSLAKINKKSATIVVFRCPLNDVTNSDGAEALKPRRFHLKSKSTTSKQLIEIQEDILISSHSNQNATNETSSANEATLVNNIAKDAYQQGALNSNTDQTENEKQVSSSNSKNGYQNEETVRNETENESMATKEAIETSNVSCLNENQKELSASSIDDKESIDDIQNKSQIDEMPAVKNHTASEVTDKTAAAESYLNENNDMSVDCVDLSIEKDTTVAEHFDSHRSSLNSTTDCVDLSIDMEDELPVKDDIKQQHNVNADDECNKSSLSDVEEVSEIIDLNESDYNCKEIKVHKILPLSTDLTDLPGIDDIILFKVPFTVNKKPACTNFIAGKVEYINKRTKNIKVLVLDGISELHNVPANFVCNLDDSQEGVNKRLQLKLTDMIEQKLF